MTRLMKLALCFAVGLAAAPTVALTLQGDRIRSAGPHSGRTRADALASLRREAERTCRQIYSVGVRAYASETCDQTRDMSNRPIWECSITYRCAAPSE